LKVSARPGYRELFKLFRKGEKTMKVLLIIAMALGISFSTGPQEVPTSLCHDPLLGPSMIIYSDCGGTSEVPDKNQSRRNKQSMEQPIVQPTNKIDKQPAETQTEQVVDQPAEISIELPVEVSTEQSIEQLNEQLNDQSTEKPQVEKHNCNKGSGNGAEGCDPGNHPEKGNNDEDGDKHPQNSKDEKQKCNKGSGNGAESCDPGIHPEKGNNDEGGNRHPQNSKNDKKH